MLFLELAHLSTLSLDLADVPLSVPLIVVQEAKIACLGPAAASLHRHALALDATKLELYVVAVEVRALAARLVARMVVCPVAKAIRAARTSIATQGISAVARGINAAQMDICAVPGETCKRTPLRRNYWTMTDTSMRLPRRFYLRERDWLLHEH